MFRIAAPLCLSLMATPSLSAIFMLEDLLAEFSVVAVDDMYSTQEVEGRVYVGGNLTGTTLQANFKAGAADSDFAGLIVGGDATIGNLNLKAANPQSPSNAVSAAIRGNFTGNLNNNDGNGGGPQAQVGGSINGVANINTVSGMAGNAAFEAQFPSYSEIAQLLTDSSDRLQALTGIAPTVTGGGNTLSFDAAPGADGVTVYETDFAELNRGQVSLSLNGADLVVVNVSGGGTIASNMLGDQFGAARNVIWNFHDASGVNFSTQWFGSILMPDGEFRNTTSTEASVFARSVHLDGEVHLQPFDAVLPAVQTATVPLPATGLLLLSVIAAGAVGGRALRRRA